MAARWSRRKLLAWNIPFLVAFAALFWSLSTYYYFFFFGPFAYTDDELLQLAARAKPGQLVAYADLKDRKLTPTGVTEILEMNGRLQSSSSYFLMPVGEKLLLVYADTKTERTHFVAPVDGLSAGVRVTVVDKLEAERPDLKGQILPLIMHGDAAFTVIGWLVLVVFTPFVLLCLFNVLKAFLRPPATASSAGS
jgi:hypothetical protein